MHAATAVGVAEQCTAVLQDLGTADLCRVQKDLEALLETRTVALDFPDMTPLPPEVSDNNLTESVEEVPQQVEEHRMGNTEEEGLVYNDDNQEKGVEGDGPQVHLYYCPVLEQ